MKEIVWRKSEKYGSEAKPRIISFIFWKVYSVIVKNQLTLLWNNNLDLFQDYNTRGQGSEYWYNLRLSVQDTLQDRSTAMYNNFLKPGKMWNMLWHTDTIGIKKMVQSKTLCTRYFVLHSLAHLVQYCFVFILKNLQLTFWQHEVLKTFLLLLCAAICI